MTSPAGQVVELTLHDCLVIDGRKHILLEVGRDVATGKIKAVIWKEGPSGNIQQQLNTIPQGEWTTALAALKLKQKTPPPIPPPLSQGDDTDDTDEEEEQDNFLAASSHSRMYTIPPATEDNKGGRKEDNARMGTKQVYTPESMKCACGMQVTTFTCKRSYNCNQGRLVAVCASRKCRFFKFLTAPDEKHMWRKVRGMKCTCGEGTWPQRAFSNRTGHEGQFFCVCLNGRCDFFEWIPTESALHRTLQTAFNCGDSGIF